VALYALYSGTQSPAGTGAALVLGIGDKIQFTYIGVSSTNNSVHEDVTGGAVTSTAPTSVVSISNNLLTVNGSSGSASYKVTGSYQGTSFSFTLKTVPTLAKVAGVLEDTNGAFPSGVPIMFYSPSGSVVGETLTGFDGSFIGEVPATSTGFEVDLSAFGQYVNEYGYASQNYSSGVSGCVSPLPQISTGAVANLTTNVVAYVKDSNSPPPPPDGCG
jgi:hypothetical protein